MYHVQNTVVNKLLTSICSLCYHSYIMEKSSTITIIDEKNLRGVLAPPEIVSKETLENLVDFIELSNP